jgi:hypothetical protein
LELLSNALVAAGLLLIAGAAVGAKAGGFQN